MARHGRDPAQFAHVQLDAGAHFWQRFRYAVTQLPLKGNPYLERFMTGGVADLEHAHPYLRPGSFEQLRALADRVEVVTAELETVAAGPPGRFSKLNLSDVFEYASAAHTEDLLRALYRTMRPGGRLAYWSLLVDRTRPPSLDALFPVAHRHRRRAVAARPLVVLPPLPSRRSLPGHALCRHAPRPMMPCSSLIRGRWAAFALLLLALAAGLPFAARALVPDNSLRVWFVDGDPALAAYEAFHDAFGNDEVILIGYRPPGGALQPDALDRLDTLAARLDQIRGVDGVYSAANAEDVVRYGSAWRVAPLRRHVLDEAFGDDDDVAAALLASPLIRDRFVSADGRTALVWVQMEAAPDFDQRRDAIVAAVRAEASRTLGPEAAHLGGVGVIYAALNAATQRDFGVFMGACTVLLFGLLGLAFGRVLPALYALGSVAAAVVLTLAVAGLMGRPLNAVTVVVPTLVVVLGVAGAVHVLTQHALAARRRPALGRPPLSRRALAAEALRRTVRPCAYAALTTAAGFLALVPAPVAALREFGVLAAVGIAATFACTFGFGAVVLPLLDASRYRLVADGQIRRALEKLFAAIWNRPGRFAWPMLGIVAVGLAGAAQMRADTYTLGYLPDDDAAVRDHAFLEEAWGDYATVDLLVRPAEGRDVLDPALLKATVAFADAVAAEPEVRAAFGLHTLLARYSAVRLADSSAIFSRPDEIRYVVRQLEEGHSADLRRLVTPDYRLGRLVLTGEMRSARELGLLLGRVDEIAAAHFEGLAEVEPAGYPPLYVRIVERVTTAQTTSFVTALLLVFGLLALVLRDLRLALVAMPANLFPVLVVFGTMGWLGIPLDVATATVAAIVLGIAVDDTIHLLVHVRMGLAEHGPREALLRSARGAGRSVVVTSLVLALGFSVLLFASVQTVFAFGLLTALAALGALVGDLVLLPLALRLAYGASVSGSSTDPVRR